MLIETSLSDPAYHPRLSKDRRIWNQGSSPPGVLWAHVFFTVQISEEEGQSPWDHIGECTDSWPTVQYRIFPAALGFMFLLNSCLSSDPVSVHIWHYLNISGICLELPSLLLSRTLRWFLLECEMIPPWMRRNQKYVHRTVKWAHCSNEAALEPWSMRMPTSS